MLQTCINPITCSIKLRKTAVIFGFRFSAVFKNDVMGEDIQAPTKEIIHYKLHNKILQAAHKTQVKN
jgi:hypothetical protein